MQHQTASANVAPPDVVSRKRPPEGAQRWNVSERTAGEWFRRMVALGIMKRVGKILVGKWSEMDAWVAAGGKAPDPAPRWRGRRGEP